MKHIPMTRRKKPATRPAPSVMAAPEPGGVGKGKPFDLFLDRSLHALYDAVMDEPLPADLLRLIEEERGR